MEIFEAKLTEIRPFEHNPRNNEAAVDKVAKSIEKFGFKEKDLKKLLPPEMCKCPKCGRSFYKI